MSFASSFSLLAVLLFLLMTSDTGMSQTYENTKAIFDDKLSSGVYHTEVRPVNNQSSPLYVGVSFELVSIVGVDDVVQKFLCNGFAAFLWFDDRLSWDPALYGGQTAIHPQAKHIWRPRTVLLNTLGERDIFEDDQAPVTVYSNGFVFWAPGGLFPTSCSLNMTNYPFDEQTCFIQLLPMALDATELVFYPATPTVGGSFYVENGEWELIDALVETEMLNMSNKLSSKFQLKFLLRRRPTFLLVNIVLPVVFLSFLNILVFFIPVESGEKISYGITVLLALSVFLSIVSSLLPRSSDIVPKVTIYLFILLIVSVLTVVDSIVIVFLSHLNQEEEKSIKAQDRFETAIHKVRLMNRSVAPLQEKAVFNGISNNKGKATRSAAGGGAFRSIATTFASRKTSGAGFKLHSPDRDSLPAFEEDDVKSSSPHGDRDEGERRRRRNKYKVISKYIDKVSFVVFFLIWLGVTLAFVIAISQ